MDRNQRIAALIIKQREIARLQQELNLELALFAKHFAQYPIGYVLDTKTSASGNPCKGRIKSHWVTVFDYGTSAGVQIQQRGLKINKDGSEANIEVSELQTIKLEGHILSEVK